MPRWRERFAPAMVERLNQLERSLETGKFCFTAEVVPPLSAAPDKLLEQAALLKGRVEAVNVTDGAAARTTMSSCAAAALLALNGVEPVLQLTCRDRNRIALCADLTGAAAFGVCNLLLLSGDSPAQGDQPEAAAVHDLDSATLTRFARDMAAEGVLPSGRNIDPPPRFHIGAADVPRFLNKQDGAPAVARKIELGARFVQTQLCYDIELIRAYIAALGEWGVLDQAKILIGLGPVASARSAKWTASAPSRCAAAREVASIHAAWFCACACPVPAARSSQSSPAASAASPPWPTNRRPKRCWAAGSSRSAPCRYQPRAAARSPSASAMWPRPKRAAGKLASAAAM